MDILLRAIIYGIPLLLAITLHEAAHGFVALYCGDDTAKRSGRLSLNPIRHIDLIGTILIPAVLIIIGAPILFGYAKPVPVNFSQLRNPRKDSIYVAISGPLMNIFLAFISAILIHFLVLFPSGVENTLKEMLSISLFINVILAVFNMFPLLPLDGGRVLAGFLPPRLAVPFSRLEPYGIFIIIGLLIIPTLLGFNVISWLISYPIKSVMEFITFLAGLS